MMGVFFIGSFAYLMGRYPNSLFYTFYCLMTIIMIIIRIIKYKRRGWHYFLLDFCYFGCGVVLVFIGVAPKSKLMYRLAFLYSNGALAVASVAFSNSLLFHKLENLISLATHAAPLVCMWNVKQVTQFQQKDLPEAERRFV